MFKINTLYKIKILVSIIASFVMVIGLYLENEKNVMTYITAIFIVLLSGVIWNRWLYDRMQEEKPFKMSFYMYDRLTLILPIGMLLALLGILSRGISPIN